MSRDRDLSPSDGACWFPTGPALAVVSTMLADSTISRLAEQVGLDRRTVQRIASRAWLRSDAAGRIAVALGKHPCEIWPEWFPAGIDDC